ncbi:MAG: hypothetical protein Q4C43_04085 [Prevotella sp.]|nr:hypothetical protein [Prevotella sp.]
MKKIFTFIAVALCAMSANAQEKLIFENGGTYTDGQELTTTSTKLTLGIDKKKAQYDVKVSNSNAAISDLSVLMMVENSETGEMEEKERAVYISGGNNPKDDNGGGYKPASANVPTNGTYYIITPSKNGKIHAGIVLNASKGFYVVKSNGECLAPNTEYCLKGADSEGNVIDITLNESYQIEEKLTGAVEFDVVANESYYVFCGGSKLGFFGYTFTESSSDGISSAVAEKAAADAPAYNLAGQKVNDNFKGIVVKNGKKVVVK